MKDFKRDVTELVGNMESLMNDAYEPMRIENEKVMKKFTPEQVDMLETIKQFGWSWSIYDYPTGLIICTNSKNKSRASVDVDGVFMR